MPVVIIRSEKDGRPTAKASVRPLHQPRSQLMFIIVGAVILVSVLMIVRMAGSFGSDPTNRTDTVAAAPPPAAPVPEPDLPMGAQPQSYAPPGPAVPGAE